MSRALNSHAFLKRLAYLCNIVNALFGKKSVILHFKYNGLQPAIKARSKTKLGSPKNRGRGLICVRASRAYTNLIVNSERSKHLK